MFPTPGFLAGSKARGRRFLCAKEGPTLGYAIHKKLGHIPSQAAAGELTLPHVPPTPAGKGVFFIACLPSGQGRFMFLMG